MCVPQPTPAPSHLQGQIDLIARHEEEFLDRRTRSERVGDALGAAIGSLRFVGAHILWIGAWIAVNLWPGTRHFDPRPFPMLNIVVVSPIPMVSASTATIDRPGLLIRERTP